MEPDLDRLLDFENGGGLFPQFGDSWRPRIQTAVEMARRFQSEADGKRLRLALSVSDPAEFCALFLGLARSNADVFFFNPKWGKVERQAALAVAKPRCVLEAFAGDRFEASMMETSGAVEEGAARPGLRVMIPTGGTSGEIRFVIHRWSTLSASVYGFQAHFGASRIVSHCMLPLYHVSGFMQLVRSLLTVGEIVFGSVERFAETHELLFERGSKDRFLSLVATQLGRLLKDETALPLLRRYEAIFVGGGPVAEDLLEEARELAIPLAPTYGMSETAAQVATLKPKAFLAGATGQGKALPHIRLAIVGESGETLPPGTEGRIRVMGSSLFFGYYGQQERQAESVLAPDFGTLDEKGALAVTGRSDRVVISGGEKIDLREVERAFEETGLVADVAAFGKDDEEWGTSLAVAYVPRKSEATEAALREVLSGKLSAYKLPKLWLRMEALPRNEAGKLRQAELLQLASGETG